MLSGTSPNFRCTPAGSRFLATFILVLGTGSVYRYPARMAQLHILSTFARKPVFGYRAMVFAIFAIGLLGFFVGVITVHQWQSYSAMTFDLTLSIGVPSA